MSTRFLLTALAAVAIPSMALAAPSAKAVAMTPAAFAAKTQVADDRLEPHATLSTEAAHRSGWKLLSTTAHDAHLRAIVDKQTGATRYEVRSTIGYWGTPRDYHAAHYSSAGGVTQAALTEARHGNNVCPMSENNIECPLSKHLAFEVDEATLRQVAAGYAPGGGGEWRFKYKDRTGQDMQGGIVAAEAAGLLQKVDAYRAGLTTASAARPQSVLHAL